MDIYISTYSRADALNDGVLIDVTEMAKQNGIKFNTCITQGLHAVISNIPDKYSYMDYNGRLWDLISICALKARHCNSSYFYYHVRMPHAITVSDKNGDVTVIKESVKLYANITGGDAGEPVITIMLPGEN